MLRVEIVKPEYKHNNISTYLVVDGICRVGLYNYRRKRISKKLFEECIRQFYFISYHPSWKNNINHTGVYFLAEVKLDSEKLAYSYNPL